MTRRFNNNDDDDDDDDNNNNNNNNCNSNIFVTFVKLRDVENTCNYIDLQLRGTHLYMKYLREKIYNNCNNVALF